MKNKPTQRPVILALVLTALISWAALPKTFWKATPRAAQASQPSTSTPLSADKRAVRVGLYNTRALPAEYTGAADLQRALKQDSARALALAAADFDEDGVADLVGGYSAAGSGLLTYQRGNVDALFPNSAEAQQRKVGGRFTGEPFLAATRVMSLPAAPEFVAAGDFNADGHQDIVTAARGGQSLYLLAGDGRGKFGAPQEIELPGRVTALASGDINRADGLTDLAVGIARDEGAQVLVFESPDGALHGAPEVVDLPADAAALAIGRLDADAMNDLAVAAGRELLTIKGRDRHLSFDDKGRSEVAPAVVSQRSFDQAIADVTLGDFAGDQRPQLALLFADGTVMMLGQDLTDAVRDTRSDISQWPAQEVSRIAPVRGAAAGARLLCAQLSTQSGQNLAVIDAANARLQVIAGRKEATRFEIEGEPAAALAMRLNGDALNDLVVLRRGRSAPQVLLSAPSATFTVTNANDSGAGSLRDAINQANATAGADMISFAIGSGAQTINLTSPLPSLNEAVTIDGTTQPGFSGAPLIELNGSGAGNFAFGLIINAANCTVKSLVINRFGLRGVNLSGAGVTGNVVQGCYIGVNSAGTATAPNGYSPSACGPVICDNDGIGILAGAHDNTIGGTTAAARNVISGNVGDGMFIFLSGTNNNAIQGNYIGTNATGTAALRNEGHGIELATTASPGPQNNSIGGTAAGAGNVVSGHNSVLQAAGIGIFNPDTNNNLVQGNFIGTNAAGTAAIPNSYGVAVAAAGVPGPPSPKNNLVGGTVVSARNVISGNANDGVILGGDSGVIGNLVQGNYIGTNAAGTAAVSNGFSGVEIAFGAQANTVGGTAAGARNILSGNQVGVGIFNPGTNGNVVQGNYIGLDAGGMSAPTKGAPPQTSGGTTAGAGATHSRFNGVLGSPLRQPNSLKPGNVPNVAAPFAIGNNTVGVGIFTGAQNNLIGGTAAGARNVISGNIQDGVLIRDSGTNGNVVQGNYVGTNAAGTSAIPNGGGGFSGSIFAAVEVAFGAQGNTIGGTGGSAGNLISGNAWVGILVANTATRFNRAQGNLIGTQADGSSPLGNSSHGVLFSFSADSNNTIGGGNTMAFNGGAGIFADSGVANSFHGNSIFSNGGLGIDLTPNGVTANDNCDGDTGPNNLQNFPVLTSASTTPSSTTIAGTMNAAPNTSFEIEFFASPACDASGNGEGQTFIGLLSVTTDANCNASFSVTFPTAVTVGQFITATATDSAGNTSEFSTCRQVVQACSFVISPTTLTFSAAGAPDTVTVTAPGGCAWTGVSNNLSFITINTGSNGSGNGTVNYTVAANPGSNPRTGTMTIAGQTFTVIQNGVTCAGTISPTSASYTAVGGMGSVSVPAPADCGWTAVSNDTWIAINSGTPGTGSGTVMYTVAANPGLARTGSMFIAGQLFTVTQSSGLQFYPLPRPIRLLDTRPNEGNCDSVSTPIAAGTSINVLARTSCESITIPSTAQAIVGNLTVINQSSQAGFLTIYPDGQPLPLAANMIYEPGGLISNNFTVGLSAAGNFRVFGERTIHVVIDISGYYAPPDTGGLYFHALSKPIRLLDTRAGEGNCDMVNSPIPGGTSLTTLARKSCEGLTIPAAAQAIAGNATVINGSGQLGYLTIYPSGVPVPLAANMVYFPGQILSNAFTVSLSAAGEFNIFAERTIDMVIDVAGYYSADATDVNGPGLLFNPLVRPLRILDTRAGQGNCDSVSSPIIGGASIATSARLICESITIPPAAQSVLGNVTVINLTSQAGFLTLYPDGVAQPVVANMVYFPNQLLSNAFVVGLNSGTGQFRIFAERTLDTVVDVSGYFAP